MFENTLYQFEVIIQFNNSIWQYNGLFVQHCYLEEKEMLLTA